MNEQQRMLERFERDSGWRQRAESGIERYRKGNGTLTVVDQNGTPVPGARVKLTQRSHAFRFGANLFMLEELETPEKNETYKKRFAELFNMATIPFYWKDLEPRRGATRYAKDSPRIYRRPAPDLCLAFCEQHGIEPREHALAYEHIFPDWLRGAPVSEVKRELERRCAEIAERYADRIRTIEVTNEMEWQEGVTAFYDEPDFVEWCFRTAEKYFPHNQLVINESTSRCWKDNCRTTDKYYSYIEANMLRGARIDAIGMQYHLFYRRAEIYEKTRITLDPECLYRHMDLYSRLGRPLQVTEVTVPSFSWEAEDEALQADLIEQLYTVWFSHPSVEQIIYWNLVDGYAHVPEQDPLRIRESQGNMTVGENYYYGGLLRFDLSPKPAYERIRELIQKRWCTREELVTGEAGSTGLRGFFGDYEVEITANGSTRRERLTLAPGAENRYVFAL